MTHLEEITQRIKAISAPIASYLDGQLYLDQFADQSEDYTLYEIFPLVLRMVIGELKELGIRIHYSLDEIYDNPRLINAVVALREIFDKDVFYSIIFRDKSLELRISGILDSSDVETAEQARKIIEVLENLSTADKYKLEEIAALDDAYTSSALFQAHISACIDRCIPRSVVTDDTILDYKEVVKAIVIIQKHFTELCEYLNDRQLLPFPLSSHLNYFKDFAHQWYQMDKASTYRWLLEVKKDYTESPHPNIVAAVQKRFSEWADGNPYVYNPQKHNSVIDIAMAGIIDVLASWAGTRETMRPVKMLLYPVTDTRLLLDYLPKSVQHQAANMEDASAVQAWWTEYYNALQEARMAPIILKEGN